MLDLKPDPAVHRCAAAGLWAREESSGSSLPHSRCSPLPCWRCCWWSEGGVQYPASFLRNVRQKPVPHIELVTRTLNYALHSLLAMRAWPSEYEPVNLNSWKASSTLLFFIDTPFSPSEITTHCSCKMLVCMQCRREAVAFHWQGCGNQRLQQVYGRGDDRGARPRAPAHLAAF